MQENCFQELFPWYRASVEQMKLVAFRLPEAFRAKVLACAATAGESEGLFIRRALQMKLESLGFPVSNELVQPGPRTGVGGFPTHKRNRPEPALILNDSPTSSDEDRRMAEQAALRPAPVTYRPTPSRGAKGKAVSPSGNEPLPAAQSHPEKAPPARPATPVPISRENRT
jgi:hypothetical protein